MTFDDFVRAELDGLLRFARVLCLDRGLAEDIVQEVLSRAYRRWPDIERLDQPAAFVRKMIVNERVSWWRKWGRMVPRAEVRPPGELPDHAAGHADRELLAGELARLPARQRAVVVLRYYCGLSDAEIADTLGCGRSTVRAYLARALATLRVELRRELSLTKEY